MSQKNQFNLVKAQKYLDKLEQYIKRDRSAGSGRRGGRIAHSTYGDTFNPKTSINLNQLVLLSTDNDKVHEMFDKEAKKARSELQSRLNILRDLRYLKDLVYTTNAKIGLSDILTKKSLLEEEKQIYEQVRNLCDSLNLTKSSLSVILSNYISEKEKEEGGNSFANIQFRVYGQEELDDTIVDYVRQIEILDTERDKLNATTVIEFQFSPDTLKVLGLK